VAGMTLDLRVVERLENGIWMNTSMSKICEGDIFRLFEPDDNEQVGKIWIADEDAVLNKDVWGVEAHEE
jgi:hypothetical protein